MLWGTVWHKISILKEAPDTDHQGAALAVSWMAAADNNGKAIVEYLVELYFCVDYLNV